MFLSIRSTSGASFSKIEAFLGELGPKNPQNSPIHGCSVALKTFENLELENYKCYEDETWHGCVSAWDLSFDKRFGRHTKRVRGRGPKTSEKASKIGFLGPFLRSFKNISKTVTYVILCFALHRWWKFCANRTWFEVVIREKPPKSSPKCPILLVRETLKIYNLRNTNAMKMKLTRIVYLHETFHLTKYFGASFRVWQGVA